MRVQKTLSSHVLLSSFLLRSNRTTLQVPDRSIEFLTTQTDQSKRDILSDYVLKVFSQLQSDWKLFQQIITFLLFATCSSTTLGIA